MGEIECRHKAETQMSMAKNQFTTEQESFWAGDFGDDYVARNSSRDLLAANTHLFAKIMARTSGVKSILEFGANIGMNLRALKNLLPHAAMSAVEINPKAAEELAKLNGVTVYQESLLNSHVATAHDFVLFKGVLIHLNPEVLPQVYDLALKSSNRYVCFVEYYSQTPVEVLYRGHQGKLFKRDFAGEFMTAHPEVRLVDYGFVYQRDPVFPLDDVNWFLMENKNPSPCPLPKGRGD